MAFLAVAAKNVATKSSGKGGISGTALFVVLAGSVLAYSGLKGKSISSVAKALLSGEQPTDSNTVKSAASSDTTATVATPGTVPTGVATGGTAGTNQNIAKLLCQPLGWSTGANWTSLLALWTKESGWSNTADTRHSGIGDTTVFAYGICQARPASKLPKAGQPPDMGGTADPTAQIKWGLAYIKGRYGNPVAAMAHETANNWY